MEIFGFVLTSAALLSFESQGYSVLKKPACITSCGELVYTYHRQCIIVDSTLSSVFCLFVLLVARGIWMYIIT